MIGYFIIRYIIWYSCLPCRRKKLNNIYSLGQSGRGEEILEQGKRSNDFKRIKQWFVWGENLMYDLVTYLSTFPLSPLKKPYLKLS